MKIKNSTKNLANKPGISQLYRNKSPSRIIDPPVCEYNDEITDVLLLNSDSSRLLRPLGAIVSQRSSIMLIAGDNKKECDQKERTFRRTGNSANSFGTILFAEDPQVVHSPKFSRNEGRQPQQT